MGVVIAIDGPAGSGKSTVAKQVAHELNLAYLDTGAMYRAGAWWAARKGIDLDDHDTVAAAIREMPLEMPLDPDSQQIICAGEDITCAIRGSALSQVVSKVAVNLDVRAELVRRQQEIVANERDGAAGAYSGGRGIVAEGRDITTVVAPEAPVRVLLTASEQARLARRALEQQGSANDAAIEVTKAEVLRRDQQDSTVVNFTTAANGVTTIDSSDLTIDQTVAAVISLVEEAADGKY